MFDQILEIIGRLGRQFGNQTLPFWNASESSSPFAAPLVVPWLLKAENADFERLASFIAELMRKIRPHEWTRLYAEFRSPWIKPNEVVRLRRLHSEDAVELLGIASLSANGYTREAALRALGDLGHPRGVPYLLLRLGDWVPEVRDAAVLTLRALMKIGIAEQLLEHHYLITRLQTVERIDLGARYDEIRGYLRKPESLSTVERMLHSQHEPQRLFAYQLLGNPWNERLAAEALADPAPSVRLWLARAFLDAAPPEADAMLTRLLRDKSSRVSTTILNALTPGQILANQSQILELAFADARPVREAAHYVLRNASQPDLAGEARRRFAGADSDSISPGVVAGLGELGEETDYPAILPLLKSRRSKVREAAVKAVGRLGGETAIDPMIALLDDPNGNVRRAVTGVLMKTAWRNRVQDIRRVFLHGKEGGQTQALRILAQQSGWNSIPDLLRGILSCRVKIRNIAWQNIDGWQHVYGSRGWIRPSRDTLDELAELWSEAAFAHLEVPDWIVDAWIKFKRIVESELTNKGKRE